MKIYCIEDTSGLKYVGSTKKKYLCNRMSEHRAHKKTGRGCSSEKLDLKNAKIYLLEECDDNLRKERERYWINEIDCVNILKLDLYDENYFKNYHQKHKDKRYQQRKDIRKYQESWGGQIRFQNNCLLKIQMDIFK